MSDLDVFTEFDPPPIVPERPLRSISPPPKYAQTPVAKSTPEWVEKVLAWQPPTDLAERRVKLKWAIDGWIQQGKVGALVAAGGTGKTTLLLTLGICIATGRRFFGRQVRYGTFVLLSNDDSQDDLDNALALVVQAMRPKLTEAELGLVQTKVRVISLQGEGGIKTFSTTVGGSVLATGLDMYLMEALAGIDDLVGVALDTLRQFSGGSTNDEQVIKLTIEASNEVATATGAFVILTHHTGKQAYRESIDDMYCGSGSAAIADNSRFVLLLQAATWPDIASKVRREGHEEGRPLVLTSTRGSLTMQPPQPLYLYRDSYFLGHIEGAVMSRDQQEDERDRAILRAVREGARSKNAVYAVVKGRKTASNERVDALLGRGLLVVSGSQGGSPLLTLSGEGARFLDYLE